MKRFSLFIISLITVFSFSCIFFYTYFKESPEEANITMNKVDAIKDKITTMSLDEKIGQLIIGGFNGYTVDSNTENLIKENHLGGFILFQRNVENSNQLLKLINTLKSLNKGNIAPLFISADEEGGTVTRMPNEIKKLPSNSYIGKINNEDFSYNIGKTLGKELNAFGINMDYAPVLDINSNPNNPVIGIRSFGDNKDIVTRLGTRTMEGIKSQNVIPVVKHFPGHGDTSVDSHIGLPVVNCDLKRLNDFELAPFKSAIDKGADAVMVAHILLPKLDPKYPATLSYNIITDLLRKDIGFDGVVITDDMTMGAIMENYNIGNASVKAINAGADIVLVCHKYENIQTAINSIKKAVSDKVITEDRIDESVYRVLSLKEKYKLTDNKINSVDVNEINKSITDVLNKKY
ncbi:beta-N-acetylhexosaminidase [Clostridium sardiniense]|uniref:Beta-N-acetylhexosaminidase n=1 Tax=Clostridium sardiniense TaxID=29369 RepID=A0ABS7KU74_CLOSR|nr:beta-N-acetylhexosaminidase [Clostridium sardiniense]MBY0754356.1 beta-N-acetylhexosaminidase [Clostridium sardiniense]MDQ0462017.1 beta-N-acetylhexosaminidase [Clostridium sardiniense]